MMFNSINNSLQLSGTSLDFDVKNCMIRIPPKNLCPSRKWFYERKVDSFALYFVLNNLE